MRSALEAGTTQGWEAVDQSVHGNDSRQADYDAEGSTWSLTWSVANVGTRRTASPWASLTLPPPEGREPGLAMPRGARGAVVVLERRKACVGHDSLVGREIEVAAVAIS